MSDKISSLVLCYIVSSYKCISIMTKTKTKNPNIKQRGRTKNYKGTTKSVTTEAFYLLSKKFNNRDLKLL